MSIDINKFSQSLQNTANKLEEAAKQASDDASQTFQDLLANPANTSDTSTGSLSAGPASGSLSAGPASGTLTTVASDAADAVSATPTATSIEDLMKQVQADRQATESADTAAGVDVSTLTPEQVAALQVQLEQAALESSSDDTSTMSTTELLDQLTNAVSRN
jgi:hypothetical protein